MNQKTPLQNIMENNKNLKNMSMMGVKVLNVTIKNRNGFTIIESYPNEKINEVILKYKTKSGENSEDLFFVFNGKKLDTGKTVEESGIKNGDNIFVVHTK